MDKTLGGQAEVLRKDHQSKASGISGLWAARSRLPQSYESARLERERVVSLLEKVESLGPRCQATS